MDKSVSYYELLSIGIACVAAIISLVVWFGQRKLQREANDLQRATAELSKTQLQVLEREKARLARSQRPILHVVSFKRQDDKDIVESEYPDRVPDTFSEVSLVNVGSPCSRISVVAPGNYGFLDQKFAYQKDKLTFTFGRDKGGDDQQTFFVEYQTLDGFSGRLAYHVRWSFPTYILQELSEDEMKQFDDSL